MLDFVRQFMIRILPIFCIGLASILLITHSDPPPNSTVSGKPGFSICHLPCWAGIAPYEIDFRDALKVITANLPNWVLNIQANNAQITFSGMHGKDQIGGVIYEDRGSVGRIRLDVNFPLWILIEELGRPYCVRAGHLSPRNAGVVVVYWRLTDTAIAGIVILDPSEKWSPGVVTESILVLPSNEQCMLMDALPWMGFARLWMYQTDDVD